MNRQRRRLLLLGALSAIAPPAALSQRKVARVGTIYVTSIAAGAQYISAFKQRLHDLGWVEARNIEYVMLAAEGSAERLDSLARDLVERKVDVLLGGPPNVAVALHRATRTIPIVMANVPDPVALGLVASLARPGGNVTGISSQTNVLVAKQIELLKEILPAAKRIAMLYSPQNPSAGAFREVAGKAAVFLRVSLDFAPVERPEELEAVVQRVAKDGAQALVVPADPVMLSLRLRLNAALAKVRLPAAFANRDHALDGALLSYAPDLVDNFRLAAGYVDRILKGANPADLPVGQSETIQLVVNLKTAKALGIALPQAVLLRANEVIE